MGRELKPCPFCGGEAEVESDKGVGRVYSVVCGTCQVATRWWVSPDRAIAAWHQRQGVKPRNAARQVAARIMERMIGSIELDALEVDIAAWNRRTPAPAEPGEVARELIREITPYLLGQLGPVDEERAVESVQRAIDRAQPQGEGFEEWWHSREDLRRLKNHELAAQCAWEAAGQQSGGEWVSVEERLPEHGSYKLYEIMTTARECVWCGDGFGPDNYPQPTHWREISPKETE